MLSKCAAAGGKVFYSSQIKQKCFCKWKFVSNFIFTRFYQYENDQCSLYIIYKRAVIELFVVLFVEHFLLKSCKDFSLCLQKLPSNGSPALRLHNISYITLFYHRSTLSTSQETHLGSAHKSHYAKSIVLAICPSPLAAW